MLTNRIAIFDIDGTLTNNDHRSHYVERPKGKRDWKRFTAECDKDAPQEKIIHMAQLLHSIGYRVLLMSGRSDEVKLKTIDWLKKYEVPYAELHMRPAGDHSDDRDLKRDMLYRVVGKDNLHLVDWVFDDRNKVVKMWREEGLKCLQVEEGDF